VVGIVETPQHMTIESEPSTVGSGSMDIALYVPYDSYTLDVYTDIFVTLTGAQEIETFSDEYLALVDRATDDLESFGEERSLVRHDEVIGEANEKLADARKEYDDAKAEADEKLTDARNELNDGREKINDGIKQRDEAVSIVNENRAKLDAAEGELRSQIAQQRQNAYYAYMSGQIDQATYNAICAQIDAAEADGNAQIAKGREQLDFAWAELTVAGVGIHDAIDEVNDGEVEYNDAKIEADEKLADAKIKLDDAQEEIDDIDEPEWFFFDRRDNVSYSSYKSNSDKVAAIAQVFPVFFFFVAALVALTTMTRMVEEERTQTGTLKALGYSDGI
ncbi:MAG: hypothetical protein RRY38_03910, partial [Oscillospiraceae bacterium]